MEKLQYICPICQDDIYLTENEFITACGHGFHSECIWVAINNKSICPVCRDELPFIIKYNMTLFDVQTNIPCETMEYMTMEIDIENLRQSIVKYFPKIKKNFAIVNQNKIISKNEDILNIKPIGESPNFFIINLLILNNFDGPKISIKNIIETINQTYNTYDAPTQILHKIEMMEGIHESQTIITMSHKDFMAYCNRKFKAGTKKVKIEIPTGIINTENTQQTIQLDAFIIKKLKGGILIQLEKPYCIGIITHSGPSIPRRFYFITSAGNVCSMSDDFETSKKLLRTIPNLDYTYPGLHIDMSETADVLTISKN